MTDKGDVLAASEMFERPGDAWEGQIIPGDIRPFDKFDVLAFRTGTELRRGQFGAMNYVHLTDPWDLIDAKNARDIDLGFRFFPSLAGRPFGESFVELKISSRDCPVPDPRLDRTFAQQDPVFPGAHSPYHNLWILVGDITAIRTRQSWPVIALGNDFYGWAR